jgi:hypothetical protein
MRGKGDPVLLLDGGDCFFLAPTRKAPLRGARLKNMRTARVILNAMNFMGYQAFGLGPIDLQQGVAALQELEGEALFPFLCANLVERETKKPVFRPYTILTVGGVRFGVYSVMRKLDPEGSYSKRVLEGKELLDPEKVTAGLVPELRKKCDVILALSHLDEVANHRILDSVAGIDALIDPISKNGIQTIWVMDDDYVVVHNGVPMLRADGQGSRVGIFEMYFAPGNNRLADYEGYDGPLAPHLMSHPEIVDLVDQFGKKGRTKPLKIDFDTSSIHLVDDLMGDDVCGACHDEQLSFWKSSKHADTYSTLVKTGDQFKAECVGCHSTGYGVAFADTHKVGRFKEVQCEGCHGSEAGHSEDPKRFPLGTANEEKCWGCHNPKITQKDFDIKAVKDKVSCPKIVR